MSELVLKPVETTLAQNRATRQIERGRLFRKCFLLILALVCGALLISGAIGAYVSYQEHKAYQENKVALLSVQREKAVRAAARIEQFVRQIEQQLAFAALPLGGAERTEHRRIEFLKLLRLLPAVTAISQIDPQGREQLAVSRLVMDVAGSEKDRSQEPAFKGARPGQTWFGPVYFRKETEPYMTFAVRSGGEAGAVTVADVNVKFISDAVRRIEIGNNGKAYVVDAAGHMVADRDLGLVLRKTSLAQLPQVKLALAKGADASFALLAQDMSGDAVFTAYASIDSLEWKVFVEQPISEIDAALDGAILRAAALIVAGLLFSALAAMWLARSIVRPIRTLQEGAAQIGAGNLEQKIEIKTGDELEALGEQFNKMAADLKESYAGLERKVEERTRELKRKSRQLAVASRHKSDFLASMSHELRTPLNAILGFNEMLLGEVYGEVPADMHAPLAQIQTSGKHLLRLINNVLDLAKIEAGRMELALSDYSVKDSVENVRSTLRPLAAEKGLEFLATVPADIPLVYGDAGRITQCLMNLTSNALKFTKQGRVEISVEQKNGLLTFRVSDTGIGIGPDKIGGLFTEFKQTDATIANEYGGTGLGLSITKKFIEMHGGRIWVESELGKGSSFIFEIPLRAGGAAQT